LENSFGNILFLPFPLCKDPKTKIFGENFNSRAVGMILCLWSKGRSLPWSRRTWVLWRNLEETSSTRNPSPSSALSY